MYDWTNDGFHPDGVNQRVIRYADVLLMLAECEAEVGTPARLQVTSTRFAHGQV